MICEQNLDGKNWRQWNCAHVQLRTHHEPLSHAEAVFRLWNMPHHFEPGSLMLYYVGTLIAVLLGIDIAAQILGDRPQAYAGGLLGAGLYFIVYRLLESERKASDIGSPQFETSNDRLPSTPPPLPPEVLEKWAEIRPSRDEEQVRSAEPQDRRVPEKRIRRRRRKSQIEPLTLVERLKAFARNIDR